MNHPLFACGEQRRQDLLCEAAQVRLAAQARATSRQPGRHAAALAWLGEHLIAWGWRLRARYGNVEQRQAM